MTTDSRYFAQKAIDAANELWDKGLIDENTIEQWKHEHMRIHHLPCRSRIFADD